jgi:hypothetical protein
MAKRKIGGFITPIHEALSKDETRPAMCHAWFLNGYVYATNGSILCRQSLTQFHGIDPEQTVLLEGKVLSHSKVKTIYGAWITEFREDSIYVLSKDGVESTMQYDVCEDRRPDFEAVFPREYHTGNAAYLMFNMDYAAKLVKCMLHPGADIPTVQLTYTGSDNRAYIVHTSAHGHEDNIGLLFPVLSSHITLPLGGIIKSETNHVTNG